MLKNNYLNREKHQLNTPCLIIDLDALKKNLSIMRDFGKTNNINIRPHTKTHKCSKIAHLQTEFGAIGVCATKVSEAEVLINNNVRNVLITSPVITKEKLQILGECLKKAPETIIVVDNDQNLSDLNFLGKNLNQKINVLIDIDSGIGRTGINSSDVIDFAYKISSRDYLFFQGIQCYAGNLQHIQSYNERKFISHSVMKNASNIYQLLKNEGFQCKILTGAGTGTYDIDCVDTQVTEIQPGSYTVMDVEYYEIESSSKNKFDTFLNSMTLLTTVISCNRTEHVTVDAGTKAIYFDPNYKPKIVSHPNLIYDWNGFGDEHGKITSSQNDILPSNGDVIEMIVPHCDPTINLYDQFFIVENGVVTDIWEIDMRGKSQ